jgi:hypothetical protein
MIGFAGLDGHRKALGEGRVTWSNVATLEVIKCMQIAGPSNGQHTDEGQVEA